MSGITKALSASGTLLIACAGLALAQNGTGITPPAPRPAMTPGSTPATAVPISPTAPSVPAATPTRPGPVDPARCGLKFDQMRHDWGEIGDAAPAQHTFKFTNSSDRTITITNVRATCGCTTPQLSKRTYAPGEAGEIPVTFNPSGRKGPQTKNVIVTMDDAECPQVELTLTSTVTPAVFIEPTKIFMNDVMKGAGAVQTITLTARDPNFDVTSIEGESPVFTLRKVRSEPVQEDGRSMMRQTYEVVLAKDAPMGAHNFQFVLKTNDPKNASVNVPIGASVVGEIRATPPGMVIRTSTPSTPFQGSIQVDSRTGKPFKITGVDVDGGTPDMNLVVDFEPTTIDGRSGYFIRLNGTTPATTGQIRGTITIETDLPDEEPLRANWIAFVRDPNNPGNAPAAGRPVDVTPPGGVRPTLSPNAVQPVGPAVPGGTNDANSPR